MQKTTSPGALTACCATPSCAVDRARASKTSYYESAMPTTSCISYQQSCLPLHRKNCRNDKTLARLLRCGGLERVALAPLQIASHSKSQSELPPVLFPLPAVSVSTLLRAMRAHFERQEQEATYDAAAQPARRVPIILLLIQIGHCEPWSIAAPGRTHYSAEHVQPTILDSCSPTKTCPALHHARTCLALTFPPCPRSNKDTRRACCVLAQGNPRCQQHKWCHRRTRCMSLIH